MKRVNGISLFSCVIVMLTAFQSVVSLSAHAISIQALSISQGGYPIPAILTLPELKNSQKYPFVIMLHGTASQKNEVGGLFQRLASKLATQNIASIRFDFAGAGDSSVDYSLYNLDSAVNDAVRVYSYMKKQHYIDAENVHLVGFSQGGLIAQLTAANTNIPVVSMVTWSTVAGNGVTSFQPFFDKYEQEAKENGFAAIKYPWLTRVLNFSHKWFVQIRENTSLTQMEKYKGSLLSIAGDADKQVPWSSSLNLFNGAKQATTSMYLIKDANHLFNVFAENGSDLATDQSKAEELLHVTNHYLANKAAD